MRELPAQDGLEKFDIVTVIFKKEIPLLRLQAISIRKFFPAQNLGKILIVVNDIDENGCTEALKGMLPEYGDFATRVEIIRPDEIVKPPRNIRDRAKQWRVRHTFLRKKFRGWKGNRGWRCQQAFKLLAVSKARSDYVLILDAKNWLTRILSASDLVDSGRKPLTYLVEPMGKHREWARASFAVLGGIYEGSPVSPTTTPCIYKRAFLADALDHLEEKLGPIDYFFVRNRRGATEFMLLWAISELKYRGWQNVFSEGLAPCLATFRSSDKDRVESVLKQLDGSENTDSFCAAIHRDSFHLFSDDQNQRLMQSWIDKGLFSSFEEANIVLDDLRSTKDQRRRDKPKNSSGASHT